MLNNNGIIALPQELFYNNLEMLWNKTSIKNIRSFHAKNKIFLEKLLFTYVKAVEDCISEGLNAGIINSHKKPLIGLLIQSNSYILPFSSHPLC